MNLHKLLGDSFTDLKSLSGCFFTVHSTRHVIHNPIVILFFLSLSQRNKKCETSFVKNIFYLHNKCPYNKVRLRRVAFYPSKTDGSIAIGSFIVVRLEIIFHLDSEEQMREARVCPVKIRNECNHGQL